MEEMMGPMEEVLRDLKQKWREMNQQEPFWDVFMGFLHAINWREPWIIAILSCHVVLLGLALFTRKNSTLQAVVFIIGMAVVYCAEDLNKLGFEHWECFATQNYFDPKGVFMSAVVTGPLLLTMFIVLINYLLSCSRLLVEAKKKELIYKAKQKQRAKAEQQAHGGNSKKTQ